MLPDVPPLWKKEKFFLHAHGQSTKVDLAGFCQHNVKVLKKQGGTTPETNEIVTLICSCHNFFPLSSVQILFIPACCLLSIFWVFSTLKLRGGSPEKINKTTTSQLMPLATFVPSLGRCGQGPWLGNLPRIRKCHFLSDPCVF